MKWKYVKPLKEKETIAKFEETMHYVFPDAYKACVLLNNGGRPDKREFTTKKHINRLIKGFLSFNEDDRETLWKVNEWIAAELSEKYVAFATDPAGNLICFRKADNAVVFLDMETQDEDEIASSFEVFLETLG